MIINSFKKAGFIKNHESSQTININNLIECCTENDWNRLIRLTKLDNMKFNDFIAIDDAVTVCGHLDNSDIAKTKTSCEVKENDVIGELLQKVTNK